MASSDVVSSGKRNSPDCGTKLDGETHKCRVREQKFRCEMELEEETDKFRVLEQESKGGTELEENAHQFRVLDQKSGSGMELEQETEHVRVLEQKSWRYTFEALTHLHSLRLFLFNSMLPVPWSCVSLQATIASESPISTSPVVHCQWVGQEGGDTHKLFVPIPVCLIDYSAPLSAFSRSDHIEIKLKLLSSGGSFVDDLALLGFNYRGEPIERDGGGVKLSSLEGDESAFSLNGDFDTQLLTSKQGVTFYCRNCSAKLTEQPLCCFRGLPSTEWRELADHWFGLCCCRDGVHTKSLMARFEEFLIPTTRVCLVGSTTCNVYYNDLVSNVVDQNQGISVDHENHCTPMIEDNRIGPPEHHDAEMSCREKDENVSFSTELQSSGADRNPLKDPVMTTNGSSHDTVHELVGTATCCNGSGPSHGNEDCGTSNLPDHVVKGKSPANGFMSSFPCSTMTPFNCCNCAGLIGACSGGIEEGIQLFKCHISSDIPTGGPVNIYRFHTMERVFSHELFSSAEEDSSYRYIIRDMTTRVPLLQLVLINHESWTCSGLCMEEQYLFSGPNGTRSILVQDMSVLAGHEEVVNSTISSQDSGPMTNPGNGKFVPLFLEPVMKVMFCDTSSFNSEQLSEVEIWGRKNQSDDIYMLDSEVKSLARSLQANGSLFPESCAAFQLFHFSFLAR